jgi:hypothetical protein
MSYGLWRIRSVGHREFHEFLNIGGHRGRKESGTEAADASVDARRCGEENIKGWEAIVHLGGELWAME